MSRLRDVTFARVMLVGAVIAVVGLAGCGRKGPLELPPSAAAPVEATPQPQVGINPMGQPQATEETQRTVTGQRPGIGTDGRPVAPIGEKRHIPLDVLID